MVKRRCVCVIWVPSVNKDKLTLEQEKLGSDTRRHF